jgi:hypothetical protein
MEEAEEEENATASNVDCNGSTTAPANDTTAATDG